MRDVNHQELVEKLAVKLKDTAIPPTWAEYAKTGHGKQRPPVRKDWWQVRAAAVLLSIQKLGPVGVSKLSVKYGNRKNRGYKPEKFAPGSRNILRKVLQQLESAKLVVQKEVDGHKGRIITKTGIKLVNDASKEIKKEASSKPKTEAPAPKVVEHKKPEKKKEEQ